MIFEALRDISVTIALTILIPLTLIYGLWVFYPRPQLHYSDEYNKLLHEYNDLYFEKLSLENEQNEIIQKKMDEFEKHEDKKQIEELDEQINKKMEESNKISDPIYKKYLKTSANQSKNIAIITSIFGLLCILAGLFIPLGSIGGGLIFGGAVAILWKLKKYIFFMSQKTIFFILIGSIILIIAIGYIFFKLHRKSS